MPNGGAVKQKILRPALRADRPILAMSKAGDDNVYIWNPETGEAEFFQAGKWNKSCFKWDGSEFLGPSFTEAANI